MSGKKSEAAKKRKALERRVAAAVVERKVSEMTFEKLRKAYSKVEAQEKLLLADQMRISDTIAESVRLSRFWPERCWMAEGISSSNN